MVNIFSLLFGGSGKFTSTKKFEKAQKKERDSYVRFAKNTDSELIARYKELDGLVNSADFKNRVIKLKKEKKYSDSEEKQLSTEFGKLLKNKEVKWYFNTLKTKTFKEQKEWTLTFEDDFETQQLDNSKWITGYYWGEVLVKDHYVPAGEKQIFHDSNIDVKNSVVRLTTKKDDAKGKTWDPAIGFIERDFNYTSALISTGQSFRQKYGKFEAKVKFSEVYPVVNAFWMLGERMIPHIDVFKSSSPNGKTLECGIHVPKVKNTIANMLSSIKGANFRGKYFIFSLEWTSLALIWRINGTEVHRETKNIPDVPMYIAFCTILPDHPKALQLPAHMDIDWVRCYQRT